MAVYCPIEDRAIGHCKKIIMNGQTPCGSREKRAARQNWRDATYLPSVARAPTGAGVYGGAKPRHLAERLPYGRGRDAPYGAQRTDAAETHGQAQAQNDIPIAGRESGAHDRPKRAGTRPRRYAVAPMDGMGSVEIVGTPSGRARGSGGVGGGLAGWTRGRSSKRMQTRPQGAGCKR